MHSLGSTLIRITSRIWETLVRFMESLSPMGLVVIGIALNVLCGILDYVTGYEASFSIFYLAPVFVLAWFGSTGSALIMCLVSATTWLLADHLTGHEYSFQWILVWNAAVRMGFFVVVALALSKIRSMNRELERLTRTDSLTGALNARGFTDFADKELYRSRRFLHPLSLVYMDLDNFKYVNDHLGHHEGDRVLSEVADTLKKGTRPTDAVARLGGDEFALLLTEINADEAELVVERLRGQLLEKFEAHAWPVTVSAGVASYETQFPQSLDQMIRSADHLMYAAKDSGKNRIVAEILYPGRT